MTRTRTSLFVFVGLAAVILAGSGAAAEGSGGGAGCGEGGEGVGGAWIKLGVDGGVVYVRLEGGVPGPVWFPGDDGELEGGVQVYGELDPGTGMAHAHFGRIGRHFEVESLCIHGVVTRDAWGRTSGFEAHEVRCVPGWEVSAETLDGAPVGCGSCGASVMCCPAPGECLRCGLCGEVCGEAGAAESGGRSGG